MLLEFMSCARVYCLGKLASVNLQCQEHMVRDPTDPLQRPGELDAGDVHRVFFPPKLFEDPHVKPHLHNFISGIAIRNGWPGAGEKERHAARA